MASAECQLLSKPFQSAGMPSCGSWCLDFLQRGGVKDGVNFDDLFGDTQSLLVVIEG